MLFYHSSSGLQITFLGIAAIIVTENHCHRGALSVRWKGTFFVLFRDYLLKSTEIGTTSVFYQRDCGLSRGRSHCPQRNEFNGQSMPVGQDSRKLFGNSPRYERMWGRDPCSCAESHAFHTAIPSVLAVFVQCGRIQPCPLPVSQPTSHCLHNQGKTTNTLSDPILLFGPKLRTTTLWKKANVMTKNNFITPLQF